MNDSGAWGDDPKGDGGDVEVLRSTDITLGGDWAIDEPARRSLTPSERRSKTLREGDIVVVKSSGSEAHLGKAALVTSEVAARHACFANFVQRLRPTNGADSRYLWYVLNSKRTSEDMAVLGNTSTGLRNLNGSIIGEVRFPGPPLEEQRAIADFLNTKTARIDALIAKKRRLRDALDERWAATVARRLGGERRWDAEALPELPRSWEWIQARHVFPRVTVGVVVNPSTYFRSEGVPFIHGTDIQRGWIDTRNLKFLDDADSRGSLAKSRLASGDVVAMRVGEPGRAAEVPPQLDGANCASVLIFKRSSKLHSYLAASFLNSRPGRSQVEASQYGAAQGVLNVSDAVAIRFPVPPAAEQAQLVDELRALATRARAAQLALARQVQLLDEHRQALITAAVTGELETPGVAA